MMEIERNLVFKIDSTAFKTAGGLVADKVGLGKTAEMISLIMSNPSPITEPIIDY